MSIREMFGINFGRLKNFASHVVDDQEHFPGGSVSGDTQPLHTQLKTAC